MSAELLIPLFAAGFLALVGLGCFAVFKNSRPTETEDRLTELVGGKKAAPALKTSELLAEASAGAGGVAGRLSGSLSKLGLLLEQADNPMTPHTFFLASAGAAAAGFAAAVLGGAPAPLYPVAALAFSLGPLVYVVMVRKFRHKAFAKQMPDALELVARALRSGHSLASGLHVVVSSIRRPTLETIRSRICSRWSLSRNVTGLF